MPAITGTKIPGYCLHKKSGRGYATFNGKQQYFPGKFQSPESWQAYQRARGEWLARGGQGTAQTEAESITVTRLCAGFLTFVESQYPNRNSRQRFKSAVRFLCADYGPTQAVKFGPQQLKGIMEKMSKTPRSWNSKGDSTTLSRYYVNLMQTAIKQIFQWSAETEMLPVDVYARVNTTRPLLAGRCKAREAQPREPVCQTHVDAVLAIALPTHKAMIQLQMLTGMRPGEVCSMKPSEISFDGKDGTWTYRPTHHKTEKRGGKRIIPLGPIAQNIIRPFLRMDGSFRYLFRPIDCVNEYASKRWGAPLDGQTLTSRGKPRRREFNDRIKPGNYGCAVKRLCKKAKVPHWFPYQLRHSSATLIYEQFDGLDAAAAVLGHASTKTTEGYTWTAMDKTANNAAAAVMAKIG